MKFVIDCLPLGLILLSISQGVFAACQGSATSECSIHAKSRSECESNYKFDMITSLGNQCTWKAGALYGGYCYPAVSFCK
jgi:hypothetical protein